MSIQDYVVDNDKFEEQEGTGFCFPCYACKHKLKSQLDNPCNKCGHNLLAEDDEE